MLPTPEKSNSPFCPSKAKINFKKEIIDKLDFTKMKKFCPVKDNVKKMTTQPLQWEKRVAKDTSEKGLLSKMDNGKKSLRFEVRSRSGC